MNSKILLIFVWCISVLHAYPQDQEKAKLTTFHSISSHDLLSYVTELSSPHYQGRLSGSPGYHAAARWIANQLKEAGIKPGAENNDYFQYFPNAYSEVLSPGSLTLLAGKDNTKKEYKFPDDYFPGSNSASGTISAEVVYVGYGITAPEFGYDDYKGINVKGKIILLEYGIPYSKSDSTLLRWEPYTKSQYKLEKAKEMGAIGVLYVGRTANPSVIHLDPLIYMNIDEKVAEDLFLGCGKKYSEMRGSITKAFQPNSFSLNKKIKIKASTNYHPDAQSCNVIGIIEGSDPKLKDEAIIVGAHLDACGSPGSLFPGALDNGSGSSDILATAKALAASAVKPARTIIFIFFGGEECGLFGSKKYVESPIWPQNKVICMINLDMVGNGTGFNFANGKSFPELFHHFSDANDQYIHREMISTEYHYNYGRPRTDGAIFEKKGYKSLGLWTTGTVKKVFYHQPWDNIDGLTPEIMEDAAKMLYMGILSLSNDQTVKPTGIEK